MILWLRLWAMGGRIGSRGGLKSPEILFADFPCFVWHACISSGLSAERPEELVNVEEHLRSAILIGQTHLA